MNFELTHLVKLYWWKKERKAFYLSLHVLFSRKCLLRTILLRLQLEMGLTFYAVIISEPCEGRAICRAKAVQYPHFSIIRRWVLVWPLGMNPCPIFYSPEYTWTPKICWGIKVFPLVIIYNDSQNLSSWLCNNIVRRKLRLVTLGTLRVN